jgi:DNA-directed DNA polymerase III PolC
MNLPNFPSPHVHPQSLDSASTIEAFAKRETELQTGYMTCTDHGEMGACFKVYKTAKKNNLTAILGVEGYFRDDDCPIILGAGLDPKTYWKYAHITLHALDQEAYHALVRVLSKAALTRAEHHGRENKPLFNWADLEELGKYNITCGSGCLIGMTARHLLNNRPDLAKAYYEKVRSIFKPGNYYVEVFPHDTSKQWVSGHFLTLEDGTVRKFYGGKTLKTNVGEIKAKNEHLLLLGVKNYHVWEDVNKRILKAELVEDYIENECLPWCDTTDSQLAINKAMIHLAKAYGDPVIISDDAHFSHSEDKEVQDIRLCASGDSWKFYGHYHRQTSEEAYLHFHKTLGTTVEEFSQWCENNKAWAARFKDFKLKYEPELPTKFYPGDSLRHTKKLIDEHGRMDWSNPVYVDRLRFEIDMLHNNGKVDLLPYFFVPEEVCRVYEKAGKLTGPGRGSAAGLLLSYLLGITHVDPLRFGLSAERFLTKDRILGGKYPDIDQDLPDRNILVNPEDPEHGWLKQRYGADHVAQISVDTTLKVRSSIKDVARVTYGKVPPEIEKLAGKIPMAPQGVEDAKFVFGYEANDVWNQGIIETDPALKEYVSKYPSQWAKVQKLLGLARSKGRHASAYVISNKPLADYIPLTKVNDVVVTQYTAKWVEEAGALKYDFLVINILNDISDAIKLIQARNGGPVTEDQKIDGKRVPGIRCIPFKGKLYDVWDLPEISEVFQQVCGGNTETVFQFNTPGARQWLREFNIGGNGTLRSVEDLATFTALDRPGPLDAFVESADTRRNMLQEYAARKRGEQPIGNIGVLDTLLPETKGVLVYQESVMKAFKEIGDTTGAESDAFRIHTSKKEVMEVAKDKEIFMRGAVPKVGHEVAEAIFNQMFTFSQYGFNIGYVCAFLKYYYPLEWWCAVLRNADRNEINEKFWRYCGHLVDMPDINLSGDNFEIRGDRIRAPLSLLQGVGEAAQKDLVLGKPYTDILGFCQSIYNLRVQRSTQVENKKKPGEMKAKLGYSAVTRGIVTKLIVTGVMDSLFPPDTDVYTKAEMYEAAWAQVTKKKQKAIDKALLEMNQLTRYQMRKKILPAFSEPLVPILYDMVSDDPTQCGAPAWNIYKEGDAYYWAPEKGEGTRFVSPEEFERLSVIPFLPCDITVAVAAYVIKDRRFTYQISKKAAELILDHDGSRIKTVKWPDNKGKLPREFDAPFEESIVIASLERRRDKQDFSCKKIVLVQGPLGEAEEEEESK